MRRNEDSGYILLVSSLPDYMTDEARGRLVIAALCLLECSHYGLQEPELLDMLGALTPTGYCSDSRDLSRGSGGTKT